MTINIRIDNDNLTINEPAAIVSGSKNYYRLQAVFTSDWDGLSRYVVFPTQECSVAMTEDDSVLVPEAIIAESGVLTFGLIGMDGEGNLRITTNYVRLRILSGAREIHALPPSPADDATWESYIGKIAQGWLDLINEASGDFAKGPASSADNHVATFSGTTGKLLKDGGVLISALAKLSSPTFTGSPKAPTASEDTNSTQLATTAFVETATHMDEKSEVMLEPLGGLPAGTDISGADVKDLLKSLLIKYLPPTVTLTATQNGGGVYELGVEVRPTFTVSAVKKSQPITSLELRVGGSAVASSLKVQAQGGVQTGVTLTQPLKSSASVTARVGDGQSFSDSAAIGYTFVDPFYYGAVSSAPTDSTGVRALTKLVQTKGAKTLSYSVSAEKGRLCFAYPSSYGALKSIKDQNGFDNTADFDRSVVTVTNAASSEVSYYVYTYKNTVTPGVLGMTFSF